MWCEQQHVCEEGGIVWGELPQRDAEMYGKNRLFLSVGVVQREALRMDLCWAE